MFDNEKKRIFLSENLGNKNINDQKNKNDQKNYNEE